MEIGEPGFGVRREKAVGAVADVVDFETEEVAQLERGDD